MKILSALKNTRNGIFFILIISAVLLLSDLENRSLKNRKIPEVALFKLSSRPILNNTESGMVDALKAQGFIDGHNIHLTYYCAENDLPTANTIAQEIVNRQYDMVLTMSTPILQVMANANDDGKVLHVFGAVTDPFASGVGLDRQHPEKRPPYLAGVGTFQPVEQAICIAKELNPELSILGTPWCAHEVCSEACVRIARRVCDSLGIELMEVTVESTSSVMEATQSLVSRGAQAIWTGGDNTVEIAMDMLVKVAKDAGIPVFCNNPDMPAKGALFGLGANYYRVGFESGRIAAEILKGAEPISFPVNNVVPDKLIINKHVLKTLNSHWMLTDKLEAHADKILD